MWSGFPSKPRVSTARTAGGYARGGGTVTGFPRADAVARRGAVILSVRQATLFGSCTLFPRLSRPCACACARLRD